MYLKLHTYSGDYGFYFYSTNAEVFGKMTSLTLPSPSVKRCHTRDEGREDSSKQAETLPIMQGGEEKAALKNGRQKGEEADLRAVVGGEGKKRSVSADKPYLQKLIGFKSYKSISMLQK